MRVPAPIWSSSGSRLDGRTGRDRLRLPEVQAGALRAYRLEPVFSVSGGLVIRLARARTAWLVPLAFAASSLSSCASSGSGGAEWSNAAPGAATSEMAVRSFLDAANSEDYSRMMNLFGTADGLAVDEFGVQDVEARMIFLSQTEAGIISWSIMKSMNGIPHLPMIWLQALRRSPVFRPLPSPDVTKPASSSSKMKATTARSRTTA